MKTRHPNRRYLNRRHLSRGRLRLLLALAVLAGLGRVEARAQAQVQTRAPAQAPWWQRSLPVPEAAPDPEALLAAALQQEKARGRLDSAIATYRQVVALGGGRRASAETAARAQARLRHLRAAGLLPASAAPDPAAGPAGTAVSTGVSRIVRHLELGTPRPAPGHDAGGATPSLGAPAPLRARRAWLERALRLRSARRPLPVEPEWLSDLAAGLGAVRAALGLRGVSYYVATHRRERHERTLTPQERLLVGLAAEKEDKDFGSAVRRYRELARLSPTGGIATRLSERARRGLARCQRWQGATPSGS